MRTVRISLSIPKRPLHFRFRGTYSYCRWGLSLPGHARTVWISISTPKRALYTFVFTFARHISTVWLLLFYCVCHPTMCKHELQRWSFVSSPKEEEIHTDTQTVLTLPDTDDVRVHIPPFTMISGVFCSGGSGPTEALCSVRMCKDRLVVHIFFFETFICDKSVLTLSDIDRCRVSIFFSSFYSSFRNTYT